MNLENLQNYLLLILIAGFLVWRFRKLSKIKAQLPKLINQGAVVVDVRSAAEYKQGSRPDSVNIPLNELENRWQELDKNKQVILCCASGTRSGMAALVLKQHGFDKVVNAGPWTNTLS